MDSISITINNLSKEAAAELLLKFCANDKPKKIEKPKQVEPAQEESSSEGDLAEFDNSSGSVSSEGLLEAATKFIGKFSDPKEGRNQVKKQLKKFGADSMTAIENENREEMMKFLNQKVNK